MDSEQNIWIEHWEKRMLDLENFLRYYMINLMDNNMNIEILNENDLIILNKDDYKIQYRIKPVEEME